MADELGIEEQTRPKPLEVDVPSIDDAGVPIARAPPTYNLPAAPAQPDTSPLDQAADDDADSYDAFESARAEREAKFKERWDDLLGQYKASQEKINEYRRQSQEEQAPQIAGIEESLAQGVPPRPEAQRIPPPPSMEQERNDVFGGLNNFFLAAVGVAMIGGLQARASATAALGAMGGIFNGASEGFNERVKQDLEVWKAHAKFVADQNKAMSQEYRDTLEDRRLNLDAKMNRLKMTAAKYQSYIDMEALNQHNLVDFGKLLNAHEKYGVDFQKAHDTAEYLQAKKESMELTKQLKQLQLLRAQQQQTGGLTDEAARALAMRIWSGERNPLVGLARRGADVEKVQNLVPIVGRELGKSPQQISEAQLRFGALQKELNIAAGRAGQLDLVIEEATKLIPRTMASIENVYRTNLVPLNEGWSYIARQLTSEEEAKLAEDLYELQNMFAQIASRGNVITDEGRKRAEALMQQSTNPKQLKATTDEALGILQDLRSAPEAAIDGILQRFRAKNPVSGKALTPEQQVLQDKAKRALQMHPEEIDRINEFLRENGIPELARP